MTIRTFTADQLDAWHLPEPDMVWQDEAPKILHREVVDMGDHTCSKTMVFRAPDDGRVYQVRYEMALADGNYVDPWDGKTVEGIQVVQRPVTVLAWQPVGQETSAEPVPETACGKCRQPFDPADTRFDGHARFYLTPYCRRCVDACHDTEIADHRCVICA